MSHGILGCGRWQAFIGCRGGGELMPLPFSSLSMGRKVDDMSSGSLLLRQTTVDTFDPIALAQCCGVLADVEPWEHELAMWRDSDGDQVNPTWVGPITALSWGFEQSGAAMLSVTARDLFQWFERRILDRDRDYVGVDLGTIFHNHAVDALHHDPSPNIKLSVGLTGINGDRKVTAIAGRRAADEMRELARSGLDFTMIGRDMFATGVEIATADLGTLTNSDLDDIKIDVDGLQTETESIVIGSRSDDVLGPVRVTAGGVDADRGLLQAATSESNIADVPSAQAAADSRNALLSTTPTIITARLVPTAPVPFSHLIPGAKADLRIQALCKQITGEHRLSDVTVTAGEDGSETVNVTFTSRGTLEEAL